MGFKTVMQRLLAMLIIGGALIFGMSGIYHEAPWIIPPLIGSVKIELGGERLSADTETLTTKITKREIAQLAYFPNLRSVDFRGGAGCGAKECASPYQRTAHPRGADLPDDRQAV